MCKIVSQSSRLKLKKGGVVLNKPESPIWTPSSRILMLLPPSDTTNLPTEQAAWEAVPWWVLSLGHLALKSAFLLSIEGSAT